MTHHRHTGSRRSPSPLLSLLAALGVPDMPTDPSQQRRDDHIDPLDDPNTDISNLNRLAADMMSKRAEWENRGKMVSMIDTFNGLLQGLRSDLQDDVEVVNELTLQLAAANEAVQETTRRLDVSEMDTNYYRERAESLSQELSILRSQQRDKQFGMWTYLSNPASLLRVLEYMRDRGETVLEIEGKIAVIKGVRKASDISDNTGHWGLKESSDFVENYIRGTFPSKEEIVSGFPQEGEQKAGAPAYQPPYDNGFHPNPDSVDDTDTPTIPPVLDASRVIGEGVSVAPLDDTNGAVDEGDIVS